MSFSPEIVSQWLMRTSLEGSLLIVMILGLRHLFGRHLGPRWRIALWTLAGLKLLLPASLTFLPGIGEWMRFENSPAVAAPVAMEVAIDSPSVATAVAADQFLKPLPMAEAASPATSATGTNSLSIHHWLISAWLGGAVLLLASMLFRQLRFTRAAAVRPCHDPELRAMLSTAAREVGLRRPVGAVLASAGTTPAVFGMWNPRVLIPEDWKDRFDADGLRHVLLHELEHVRFGDVLWNWAAAGLNALHWFNPLAWMARSMFQSDRELRCDAGTLARLEADDRIAYGRTLLKVQENFHAAPAIAGLAPCVRHHSTLRQRIAMITQPASRKTWLNSLLVATIAALFCFSFGAAQADGDAPREGARDGDAPREGARDGDRPREGARDGDRPREGTRDGDRPREGARDGDRPREGARDGDRPREGTRDGDRPREGARDGDRPREGARDGDRPREGARDGDRPREGARDGDRPREGARDGDRPREGSRDGDAPREGARDGDRPREGARDGDRPREGARDGDRPREGARDGDRPREGARDGDRPREGARDGDAPREGARDGEMRRGADRPGEIRMTVERDGVILGDRKYRSMLDFRAALAKLDGKSGFVTARGNVPVATVKAVIDALSERGINDVRFATSDGAARDGEGSREGARDGDMRREGARDGDAVPREGARDSDRPREGARDGDAPREGARDGDRPREGARDGEGSRGSSSDMDRQLTRIYQAYDKNSDSKVTFEEWLAMKDGEMPRDRRDREKGWYDEADANGDDGVTLEEWQDWKQSQFKPEGARRGDGDRAREGSREGSREGDSRRDGEGSREGSREGARDGDR